MITNRATPWRVARDTWHLASTRILLTVYDSKTNWLSGGDPGHREFFGTIH